MTPGDRVYVVATGEIGTVIEWRTSEELEVRLDGSEESFWRRTFRREELEQTGLPPE